MKRPLRKSSISAAARKYYDALNMREPELLTDEYFSGPAPRAAPKQREKVEVQRPLVFYLRKHLPAGSIVHAEAIQPLNENHKFAMQRDGVQFGMPDILVIVRMKVGSLSTGIISSKPCFFFIECKSAKGTMSASQHHTQALLIAAGCNVLPMCRSVEEGVAWLRGLGVEVS